MIGPSAGDGCTPCRFLRFPVFSLAAWASPAFRSEALLRLARNAPLTGVRQPLVAQHHGRVVKVMGDGVLVEFASAVNAVDCGVELQAAMDSALDIARRRAERADAETTPDAAP